MKVYEETETTAVEEKRKRLHYESIRIEESRKETQAKREDVDGRLAEIESVVKERTLEHYEAAEALEVQLN